MTKAKEVVEPAPGWHDEGLQYGIGAFESMRADAQGIPLWRSHRERLGRALEAWGLGKEYLEVLDESLSRQTWPEGGVRVKLIVSLTRRGPVHHLRQEALPELGSPLRPLRLLLETCDAAEAMTYKSCSYERHWLAWRRAQRAGCDDTLYVMNDHLLECSRAAVGWLENDVGILSEGPCLDSVCARRLIELDGRTWRRGVVDIKRLSSGSGRLVCLNAVRGLMPVGEVVDVEGRKWLPNQPAGVETASWNERLFTRRK